MTLAPKWRRAAVEPVIGHLKDGGRNHLKGRDGDRINAVLAAAGYNLYGPFSVKKLLCLHPRGPSRWLISMTAIRVLSCSRTTRDLLKSSSFGMAGLLR
jgi:hypothetical protein